jgi:hypothetical protein
MSLAAHSTTPPTPTAMGQSFMYYAFLARKIKHSVSDLVSTFIVCLRCLINKTHNLEITISLFHKEFNNLPARTRYWVTIISCVLTTLLK